MSSILSAFLVLIFILPLPGIAIAGDEATVEFFSPQNTVKGVRQVTARFPESMVPFGDPRIADPFEITCPEKGRGRWADGKNWVYDFDRELPAGVKCAFRTKPDLKALSGKSAREQTFAFSTGGPAIVGSRPASRSGSFGAKESCP